MTRATRMSFTESRSDDMYRFDFAPGEYWVQSRWPEMAEYLSVATPDMSVELASMGFRGREESVAIVGFLSRLCDKRVSLRFRFPHRRSGHPQTVAWVPDEYGGFERPTRLAHYIADPSRDGTEIREPTVGIVERFSCRDELVSLVCSNGGPETGGRFLAVADETWQSRELLAHLRSASKPELSTILAATGALIDVTVACDIGYSDRITVFGSAEIGRELASLATRFESVLRTYEAAPLDSLDAVGSNLRLLAGR